MGKEEHNAFELPSRDADMARLVDAVPNQWEWVDGYLAVQHEAKEAGLASERTGIRLSRSNSNVTLLTFPSQEERAAGNVVSPDFHDIFVEGKLPSFVSFQEAGYRDSTLTLEIAKQFAVSYIRRGYRGWLTFCSNCNRNDKDNNDASCRFNLEPWHGNMKGEPFSVPSRNLPALIQLSWSFPEYRMLLEPIFTVCEEMGLREVQYQKK